ncbi:unnamed protein product, partial [Didymodactylos carnosus]
MPYNYISAPPSSHDSSQPPEHLTTKQKRVWRRNKAKNNYNEQLRTTMNLFTVNPSLLQVNFFNYATTSEELNYLVHVTEQASSFTIDTESTRRPYLTNLPSLIQVQVNSNDDEYNENEITTTQLLILFDCAYLPQPTSSSFI